MLRITAQHLKTAHGLTATRYLRLFPHAPLSPSSPLPTNPHPTGILAEAAAGTAPPIAFPPALLDALADAVSSSQEVRNRLADEVGETIFQSPHYKHHLRSAITTLISVRLAAHTAAVEHFSRLAQEARQPWRTAQGGPNGAPTPTAELLNAMNLTLTEIKHGDDVLLRAVKLAIDEAKSERDHVIAPLDQLGGGRYTGKDEGIVIPPDITPIEREQCRTLFNVIVGGLARRRAAGAQPIDVSPLPQSVSPSSALARVASDAPAVGDTTASQPPPVAQVVSPQVVSPQAEANDL